MGEVYDANGQHQIKNLPIFSFFLMIFFFLSCERNQSQNADMHVLKVTSNCYKMEEANVSSI